MGIKDFAKLLKLYAPQAAQPALLHEFSNQSVAIDAPIFNHVFLHQKNSNYPNPIGRVLQGHFNFIQNLKKYHISPIYVFDGPLPLEKIRVRQSRQSLLLKAKNELILEEKRSLLLENIISMQEPPTTEILELHKDLQTQASAVKVSKIREKMYSDTEDILLSLMNKKGKPSCDQNELDDCQTQMQNELHDCLIQMRDMYFKSKDHVTSLNKRSLTITPEISSALRKLLQLCQVPVLRSPHEAESLCAYLSSNSYTALTFSQDTDTVVFGTAPVLKNATSSPILISPIDIQEEMELSRQQFVDLCILLGCDFSTRIKKVGVVNAVKLIKQYGNIEKILEAGFIGDSGFNYLAARRIFADVDGMEKEAKKLKNVQGGSQIDYVMLRKFLAKYGVLDIDDGQPFLE